MRASLSFSTMVPRALRTNFVVRLIMPCRLPWACAFTLPAPVILKRFLAPLLVFSLGILLSLLARTPLRGAGGATGLKHEKPPRHAPPGGLRCSHTAIGADVQRLSARRGEHGMASPSPASCAASRPAGRLSDRHKPAMDLGARVRPGLARRQHHHHLPALHTGL